MNAKPSQREAGDEPSWQFGAAVAAWLIPGLGHLLIGEKTRGLILAGTIYGLFFLGLLIGGIDVVDSRNDRLWFLGQCLVGPVAPLVNAYRARMVPPPEPRTAFGPRYPRATQPMPEDREQAYSVSLGRTNELGMLYATLAGMLNLLAIIDVLVRHPSERPAEAPQFPKRTPPGGGDDPDDDGGERAKVGVA